MTSKRKELRALRATQISKRKNHRALRASIRRRFLRSRLFLSGGKFTCAEVSEIMPKAKEADIQNLTSILKIEGIITAIVVRGKPTVFYKTQPAHKPWLSRSWRTLTNAQLGIKESSFR